MRTTLIYSLICFFIFRAEISSARSNEMDSLKRLLSSAKEDTGKVNILDRIAHLYSYIDIDQLFSNAKLANQLSIKLKYNSGILESSFNIADYYRLKGDLTGSMRTFLSLLKIADSLNNRSGIANAYHGIANIYSMQDNNERSIEYNLKALEIRIAIKDSMKMSYSYINLGAEYFSLKQYEKAKTSLENAMAIQLAQKNYIGYVYSLGNLGNIYEELKDDKTALDYYFKALKILDEHPGNDERIKAGTLSYVGDTYLEEGKYKESLDYLFRSLKIYHQVKRNPGDIYEAIAQDYYGLKDYKNSIDYYKKFWSMKDSIFSSGNTQKTVDLENKYNSEKEEKIKKILEEKKESEHQAEVRQQKIIIYSVAGGLMIVLASALFIFRSLRITRRQKILIEDQKKQVEEKQKEILDSIHYAKRIQRALLPREKYIQQNLDRLNE